MLGAAIGLVGGGVKAVDVNPTYVDGSAFGPATASTGYVSVIQQNLVPPLTYTWSRVSGDTTIRPDSSYSQTVRFLGFVNGGDISGTWRCSVTDNAGFSGDTPDVYIYLTDRFV